QRRPALPQQQQSEQRPDMDRKRGEKRPALQRAPRDRAPVLLVSGARQQRRRQGLLLAAADLNRLFAHDAVDARASGERVSLLFPSGVTVKTSGNRFGGPASKRRRGAR